MKKFMSFLLSAGLLLGFTACGGDDDNDDKGGGGNSGSFTCKVTVAQGEDKADVTVTASNTTTEYLLWVVKQSEYKADQPADALKCTGNVTKTFTGLTPDTEYYAVVYEEKLGYKTTEFLTDQASISYPSLEGSNYYTLSLDAKTAEKIQSKVVADLSCDDLTTFFDWWNGGAFSAGVCSGPNFYGEVDGWFSLIINSKDAAGQWFGGAFRLINPTAADIGEGEGKVTQEAADAAKARRDAMKKITTDYTLHLAMKSSTAGDYTLGMLDGATVLIGDENATYGFKRDGAWHEIEIPMSAFMVGDKFSFDGVNLLYFTQGPDGSAWPTNLDLDAAFIYKKK